MHNQSLAFVIIGFFLCTHRPNFNPNERPPTPEDMKLAPAPDRTVMHPIFVLAFRRLLEVINRQNLMLFSTFLKLFRLSVVFGA